MNESNNETRRGVDNKVISNEEKINEDPFDGNEAMLMLKRKHFLRKKIKIHWTIFRPRKRNWKNLELNYWKSVYKVFPVVLSSGLLRKRAEDGTEKKIKFQKIYANYMVINWKRRLSRRKCRYQFVDSVLRFFLFEWRGTEQKTVFLICTWNLFSAKKHSKVKSKFNKAHLENFPNFSHFFLTDPYLV